MGHFDLYARNCEVSRFEDGYEDPVGRSIKVVDGAYPLTDWTWEFPRAKALILTSAKAKYRRSANHEEVRVADLYPTVGQNRGYARLPFA